MLRVVVCVIAMLATATAADAINSDCNPSSRNGDCPQSQRRAHQLEHINAGSSQPSLPLGVVGVWGFSELGCELHRTRGTDRVLSNTPSSNFGIIYINNSSITWMYWEAATCVIAPAEISTSRLSTSFPAHCTSKNQTSDQFVIISMHGNNSMRLTFLASRPFFKADDYVKCSPSQVTTHLEVSKEVRKSPLHQTRSEPRQREKKARHLERNPPSRFRQRTKITGRFKAKARNPLAQASAANAFSNWPKNISPALFSPEF
jgi:hypothetical protein